MLQSLGLPSEGLAEPGESLGGEVVEGKNSGRVNTNISPRAVELAQEFYEAGKMGERWYYDAANTIQQSFPDEQERVLFALLLAATSVQNEIYTNLIEASVLFNAIMKDARDNIDLLTQWVYDPEAPGMDQATATASQYKDLNIYTQTIAAKIINLGAKLPNIARALQLYLQGNLTKQAVKNSIASTIELNTQMSFDQKSPFFRKLKIANFALTLVDPEFASSDDNWFNVVVDTWMFRVFYPGADKEDVNYLFGQESAYANVSRVVSDLAKKAGVSPHVMQAAIWLGIKQKTEGAEGGVPDYVSAIEKLVHDYSGFWKGMAVDTKNLRDVITKLDTETAKDAINRNRGDILRARVAKTTAKNRAEKAKVAADAERAKKLPGQVAQAGEVERVKNVLNKMGGGRQFGLRELLDAELGEE